MPKIYKVRSQKRITPFPNLKARVKTPLPATQDPRSSQRAIHNILNSEFSAVEEPLSPSALGDLSNAILPIFRAANFQGVKDYSVIAPSTRLASLLLSHASIQPILRTVLFHGPLIPLGEEDNEGKPLYEYPADRRAVLRNDISMINAALDELAEFVTFAFVKERSRGSAFTDPLKDTRPGNVQPKHLPGLCSETKLSKGLLDALAKATREFRRTQDTPLLLTLRFNLAVELVHEVCHALNLARDGHLESNDTEAFFPGALIAELGFAVEDALFGGHYTTLWDNNNARDPDAILGHLKAEGEVSGLAGMPVLWNWPCTWIALDYLSDDAALWIRQANRADLPKKDIAWRVPVSKLAKYFSMSFWDRGSPSLHLPRNIGFAFACSSKGEKTPANMTAADMKRNVSDEYCLGRAKTIIRRDRKQGRNQAGIKVRR